MTRLLFFFVSVLAILDLGCSKELGRIESSHYIISIADLYPEPAFLSKERTILLKSKGWNIFGRSKPIASIIGEDVDTCFFIDERLALIRIKKLADIILNVKIKSLSFVTVSNYTMHEFLNTYDSISNDGFEVYSQRFREFEHTINLKVIKRTPFLQNNYIFMNSSKISAKFLGDSLLQINVSWVGGTNEDQFLLNLTHFSKKFPQLIISAIRDST